MVMSKSISLGMSTKKLLEELCQVMDDPVLSLWNQNKDLDIEQDELLAWLKQKNDHHKQTRFLLESLRAALLEDLCDSFLSPVERSQKKVEKPAGHLKKVLFGFLSVAGTLVAMSEGFDATTSVLGSFMTVSSTVLFVVGMSFSLLSIGLFYFVDFIEISKSIGVKIGKANLLLDVFLKQLDQINQLKQHIDDTYTHEETNAHQRGALQRLLLMLISFYDALDETRDAYLAAVNGSVLNIAKWATAAITALFFFGGGFFAGQTLALAVAGLFVASVSATFWPIVVASIVVGLAALSLYWFVQRPALDHIVGHWMGLDKQRVDALVSKKQVSEGRLSLQHLSDKLDRFHRLATQLETLTGSEQTRAPFLVSETTDEPIRSSMMFHHPSPHPQSELSSQPSFSCGSHA
jgi:hypothetical protein